MSVLKFAVAAEFSGRWRIWRTGLRSVTLIRPSFRGSVNTVSRKQEQEYQCQVCVIYTNDIFRIIFLDEKRADAVN